MSDYKLLRKMKAKDIMGITAKESEAKAEWRKLAKEGGSKIFTVAGEVFGYKTMSTNYGPSTYLTGIFVGRNNKTGQIFKSSTVFLPIKSDIEAITAQFDEVKKHDPQGIVGFTFVYSVEEAKDDNGYTYVSEPTRSPEQVTREAQLIGTLAAAPLIAHKGKAA